MAADAEHAENDCGEDASSRQASFGEEGAAATAHLPVPFDLNGEARNGGAACRRRWRARAVAGEEGGRGRVRRDFLPSSSVFREITNQSFAGFFCEFSAQKFMRGGDRLEPARPAGDRATWRHVIGRKSTVNSGWRFGDDLSSSRLSRRGNRTADAERATWTAGGDVNPSNFYI